MNDPGTVSTAMTRSAVVYGQQPHEPRPIHRPPLPRPGCYAAPEPFSPQEGGRAALRARGINLVSILTLDQIATYLRYSGRIEAPDYERVVRYIQSSQGG